jgi:Na+/serine symporter
MSEYWQGVITPFAVIGALLAGGALVWLVVVMLPEGVWWTVKRLPLADQWARDRAAAVVAASRRAYILRIPLGVRLIVSLGGDRDKFDEVLQQLHRGRQGSASASITEKE